MLQHIGKYEIRRRIGKTATGSAYLGMLGGSPVTPMQEHKVGLV